MATITEDYVSFETAKLLKEKGFGIEEETRGYYPIKGDATGRLMFGAEYHHNTSQVQIAAPSQAMAMKWLREVHNIDIEVHADVGMLGVKVYTPFISRYKSSTEYPSKLRQYKTGLYFEDDRGVIPGIRHFETYEEAVEEAIRYYLEHLIG